MKRHLLSLGRSIVTGVILASSVRAADLPAGPDPKEIPLPVIETSMGRLPGVDELPARPEMPDVLTMNDGTKVSTVEQWRKRREEIKRTLEYYAVGQMPPPPGNVKGQEISSKILGDGSVKYRLVDLTFGPQEELGLDIGIFTPNEGGPFPAVILQTGTPPGATPLPRLPAGPNQGRRQDVLLLVGPKPAEAAATTENRTTASSPQLQGGVIPGVRAIAKPASAAEIARNSSELFRRGYALVVFNPNDCAEDTTLRNPDGSWAFRTTRFFPAYPDYDWGILAGWAWGASRIADYLKTDPAIDKSKLIVTGASRYGKS
jgi:hypothetical protein